MDVTAPTTEWPDSLLRDYGQMMSVRDVAQALNIEESNVRGCSPRRKPRPGCPGSNSASWRIDRDQLRAYLRAHHNDPSLSSTITREAKHGDR